MTDRHVDARNVLAFLVDDRIDGHSRLAGLAVADDQFALTAPDRYHRVNRLQAGLQWLVDRFTGDHTRRDFFDHVGQLGVDRAFAVDRLTQRVDHSAQQLGADRDLQNAAGALDRVAFGNVLVLAQHHGADRVTLEVQCQTVSRRAVSGGGEFKHLALHHIGQAVDTHDTVSHRHHSALVANVAAGAKAFNTALDQFRNFCWIELHDSFLLSRLLAEPERKLRRSAPLSFVPNGL